MTGIIAGVKGKRAVLLNNDGEFIEIADRGYEVGQKIDYKKPSISAKYAYIAACFILLMFVGFSSYAAYFTSVSFISIDINPSFRIDINRFDRVISVKPLNDDARQLLELNKVKSTDINKTIGNIIKASKTMGFLNKENNNYVEIDVVKNEKLADNIYEYISKSEDASSIEVAVEKASENDVELSRDLDVSLGRARAIKEYTQEFGGDIKENANNLSNMSVGEIRRELAKNRKERLKEAGQNQDNANQNTRHSLKAGSEKDKQKADKKDREKLDRQILRDTRDNTTKNSQRDNEREANEANQKKTPNTKSERDRKNPNDNKNNKDKNKNPDFGRKS